MPKKHCVQLTPVQRKDLQQMLRSGKHGARELARAQALLKADEGLTDEQVVQQVGVALSTVERARRSYCQHGLEAALQDKPHPPRPEKRKISGEAEAHLIALSCSKAPEGYDHWTMQLLAQRMVQLHYLEAPVSDETVRRCLKKTSSSLG